VTFSRDWLAGGKRSAPDHDAFVCIPKMAILPILHTVFEIEKVQRAIKLRLHVRFHAYKNA
jgi:hypothetical protein